LNNPKTALIWVDGHGAEIHWSYNELRHRSNPGANFLKNLSLEKGDTPLLMMCNSVPLFELLLPSRLPLDS